MLGHAVVGLGRGHLLLLGDLGSLLLLLAGGGGPFRAGATAGGVLAGHDVDEEVEHVGLGEGGGDVGALQGAALVVFGVDPGAHGEFGDEDVAALGEEDGRFGRDHLYFRVGFHDFFDAREGELVDFEVVAVGFEVVDCLLPVGGEDVAGDAGEALVYLRRGLLGCVCWSGLV